MFPFYGCTDEMSVTNFEDYKHVFFFVQNY